MVHASRTSARILQARWSDEHVERVGNAAVGGVFERDEAELDVSAVHFLEHGGDRADRDVLDGVAELGDRGQMTVAVVRSQEGHAQGSLQGAAAAHELSKDEPECFRRQRTFVGRDRLRQDFFLAAGDQTSIPCCSFT